MDASLEENPSDSTLEAQRTAAITQLISIDTRIEQISTNAALYGSGVQLYVPPDLPESPIRPQPIRGDAVIAAILGALAAGVWAWWRADRHRAADDRNAPAAVLDAPLLATVPKFSAKAGELPVLSDPASAAAEAYRFALSSMWFALEGVKGVTVVITSPSPGDGKTVTAANLVSPQRSKGSLPSSSTAIRVSREVTVRAQLRGQPRCHRPHRPGPGGRTAMDRTGRCRGRHAPRRNGRRRRRRRDREHGTVPLGHRGMRPNPTHSRSSIHHRHSQLSETAGDPAALADGIVVVVAEGTPSRTSRR